MRVGIDTLLRLRTAAVQKKEKIWLTRLAGTLAPPGGGQNKPFAALAQRACISYSARLVIRRMACRYPPNELKGPL